MLTNRWRGGNSVLYELESCDNKVVISLASDTIERDLVRIYGDKLSENINIETLISQKLGIPELSRDTVKEASEDEITSSSTNLVIFQMNLSKIWIS